MNQTKSVIIQDFVSSLEAEEYFFEIKRFESFKLWPFSDDEICNKITLAKAGFYWCGNAEEPDSAACFICFKQLDNWESSDDPWQEHKKHAPQCTFVKLGKEEDNMTVTELFQMAKTFLLNKLKNTHDTQIQLHKSTIEQLKEKIQNHFHKRKNI